MKRILLGGVAALFAVILLFSNLTTLPLGINGDEANNGIDSIRSLELNDYRPFYQNGYGREGMNIWLGSLAIHTTGLTDPWVLRIPSLVFSVLLVVCVYLLIIEVLGRSNLTNPEWFGLLGAMLMLTSIWYLNLSRVAFTGSMAATFATLSVLFILYANRTRNSLYLIPASIVLGLGVYSYMPFRLFPIVMLPILTTTWVTFPKWKTILYGAGALLLALPMVQYSIEHPDQVSARAHAIAAPVEKLGDNSLVFFNMFAKLGDPSWLQNIPGRPMLGIILTLMALCGFVWWATRNKTPLVATLVLWFGLGAVAHVLGSPEPYFLRFFIAVPVLFVCIALAAAYMAEHLKLHTVAVSSFVAIVCMLRITSVHADFEQWLRNPALNTTPNTYELAHWEQAGEIESLTKLHPVYVMTGSQHFPLDEGDLPVVAIYVMYRMEFWDSVTAAAKGVYFVNAERPDEVNAIPAGAYVYYM